MPALSGPARERGQEEENVSVLPGLPPGAKPHLTVALHCGLGQSPWASRGYHGNSLRKAQGRPGNADRVRSVGLWVPSSSPGSAGHVPLELILSWSTPSALASLGFSAFLLCLLVSLASLSINLSHAL